MDRTLPRQVDTVIVGNGPSALILSYILHGNIPIYDPSSPHPDHLLHEKLKHYKDLLSIDVDKLTEHFGASRFSYSTQALPANVLLDTLIRPLGETEDIDGKTCLRWQYDAARAIPHVVLGNTIHTGGQWADNPVQASWDIGTLSYAGMLSLPGYSFADFYVDQFGKQVPDYLRPSRREIAAYFAQYPAKVGILDSMYSNQTVYDIRRQGSGFYIASHNLSCNHLVLASGIFTSLIPPRALLQPLLSLPDPYETFSPEALLVIGSGFSAADVIISAPSSKKIIHIFKWNPSKSPSPLRACHQQAYPEYAGVYRKMKLAAIAYTNSLEQTKPHRPMGRRSSSSAIDPYRDWNLTYEGLPNTAVIDVQLESDQQSAVVTLQHGSNPPFHRKISSLAYVIGRRGSLSYLDHNLQHEICPSFDATRGLSNRDMRDQANEDLEVADNVFIIGSLTGDSLIRFAYGGCVYAAGKIMERSTITNRKNSGAKHGSGLSMMSPSYVKPMNGLDGHQSPKQHLNTEANDHGSSQDQYREPSTDGVTLDRRKIVPN